MKDTSDAEKIKVDEAVSLITAPTYNSGKYREWVESRYSLDNFNDIHNVIKEIQQ